MFVQHLVQGRRTQTGLEELLSISITIEITDLNYIKFIFVYWQPPITCSSTTSKWHPPFS